MFVVIFFTCLAMSQLALHPEPGRFLLLIPLLGLAACILFGFLRFFRPRDAGERRVSRLAGRKQLRRQARLTFYLLINILPFALLLGASDAFEADSSGGEQQTDPLYLEGRSYRDGRLNFKGEVINYLLIEHIETETGLKVGHSGRVVLYGMEERFFRGQGLKLYLPRGLAPSSREVFLLNGFNYRGRAELVESTPPAAFGRIELRRELDMRLEQLGPEGKAFVQSLILAYRSEMGAGLQNLFRSAGVIHILVLSGMHLGIIYMVLRVAIPGFIPLALREIIALATMGLYLWFINPGASAWRAALMIVLWTVSRWSGWKIRPDSMLVLVWSILIVLKPRFIFDAGMYLSFAAIWGLGYAMPVFHFMMARAAWLLPLRMPGVLRQRLSELFVPSLSAQAVVSIPALLLFGSIAPQGLLALPLVLPFFYASLTVSALLIPVLFLLPGLGLWLGSVLKWLINVMGSILFPFASFGWRLESWPLALKYVVGLLPIALAVYCRFTSSLLSSGHVQLRFDSGNQKPAQRT